MNILHINNKAEFDETVWQTDTNFNEKDYNSWLKNATNNLQKAKSSIEELQKAGDNIDSSILKEIDVYMLGDLVNLLTTIQIKTGNIIRMTLQDVWISHGSLRETPICS